MSQLGRISGQLLKDNLTRNGHDLTFDKIVDANPLVAKEGLLHLDVTNRRVGINTETPAYDLDVDGITRTTELEVTTQADIANLTFSTDTITSNTGTLNLTNGTGDQINYQAKLVVDNIELENNVISTNTGANLELRPNGTGTVDIYADTNVYGNVHVTGNIRADGNITVGDATTDNITINADVASDIIPNTDITYTLGNGGTGYVEGLEFTLGDVTLTVSGTGTTVVLSIPAAGPGWINTLIAHTAGKSYQLALDGTPGSYSVNTLGSWTGTNPKTVTTTNDSLVDGVYNVASIRFDQKRWLDLWVKNVYADAIVSGDVTIDGIDLNSVQGKIYYVATNGSDTNAGEHQNDPFASVKHALSVATADDTVYIYPGTYTEQFPLTVPTGVVVKGTGIRSVKIIPTTATRYNDAFLLNGETTVEDITIADFFSGGNYFAVTTAGIGETVMNVGTAPFAHTWVSGGTINISGTDYSIIAAIYSHTTGVLTVNHVGPNATGASPVFLSGLIFSCNGGNRVFPDNGYAFRFATDFAVTSRSPYIRNITVLTKGNVTSLSDPLGYDAGDAGRGAYIDGAYATAVSKEASMLFHSATFICPGVDIIVATNGARVEWLNSFTYYANRSMHLYSSNDGFASDGKTRVKITDTTGTWAVGNTLSYYDTDGTTVLASGVIESIDGDFYNIDTRVLGFEQIQDRTGKTISVNGNAKLSTAVKKFGTASLALDGTGDYLSIATQPDFAFPSTARLAKTITVNGTAAVSATQSKFGGSSIEFSGANGTYLGLASNTDFGFGTGDFTIEGWFYKTTTTTKFLFDTRSTLIENSIAVQSSSSNTLRLYVNGTFLLTTGTAHTSNAWNHLAISRASGVTRFFINGVVAGSVADTTNYGSTKPLVVGALYNGTTAFAGYIDDFRVSNTARYTTTFTPTTTAFVDDVDTRLLVNGNSSIADNVGGTITDFTLEAWIYPTATTYHSIFDFRSASTEEAIYLGINLSNQVYLYVNGVVPITTAAISLNVWTHVAVVRYNASTKIYINGTQSGSSWADITNYGTTKPLRIGAWYNALYGFTGYIDDVRITKGVARYTATFPVPTAQLTGDLSTVLLITCNGVNNSTAIVDNGITLQDLRTSAGGTASIIDFADYSDFGVELRSIGSAAVYGNYGIYGDGLGVIAYLIGQNLAYIGNGKATTNDPVTVIQANEVVELDGAKIFYNSVDHKGDFRIGDLFYVNQATGEVSFTNSAVSIGTSLTFDNGLGDVTFIDATKIETGDFRISGNTVETLTQDFNVDSASNQINLQSNVTVTGNLGVTGDVTVGGNVTIGNESTDVVRFVAGVDSDILPALDSTYDLGTTTERWSTLYSTTLINANIQISTNVITTTNSNLDLTLQANGTGRIYVPANNVEITNNLTVNGVTDVQALNITGTLTHVGDATQTGNLTQTGDITLTGTFTTTGYGQFADIKIDNNNISTTVGTNDLVLDAAGTGRVYVPTSDVEITQDLTVTGYIDVGSLTVGTSISSLTLTAGDIKLESNFITTLTGNNNLELRANGSGLIYVPSNDVEITNNLTVLGTTDLKTTNIGIVGTPSTVTHVGAVTQTGNLTQTGSTEITGTLTVGSTAQFQDIKIDTNIITTTVGTNNLILSAAGTGRIYVPTNDVTIENTLTVVGTTTTSTISNTGTVTSGTFNTSNVSITSNNITSRTGNSDLVLEAAGTGRIYVPTNSVQLDQNLTVNGTTYLKDTTVVGTITHTGAVTQTGNLTQTGSTEITGTLTVGSTAQFQDIKIDTNVITTTIGNNNLTLKANGTGIVIIPDDDVSITQTLTVTGTTGTTTINNTGTITSDTFNTTNVSINANNITSRTGNSNLVLEAAGSGKIYVPSNSVQLDQNLTVNGTTYLKDTNIGVVGTPATITHVGAVTQTGDLTQTGNTEITGTLTVGSTAQFEDIKVDLNIITTTVGSNDLILEAAGTGKVLIPTNDTEVTGTLTVVGATSTSTIGNTGTVTSGTFSTGDISISTNTIATTLLNSNLVLEADGNGIISIPTSDVELGQNLTVLGTTTLSVPLGTALAVVGDITHTGAVTQTGDVNQTGNLTVTGTLDIGSTAQFEDIKVDLNIITTTIGNNDLVLEAAGTGKVIVPVDNAEVTGTLTVVGATSSTTINNTGTVTSGIFSTGNIRITTNNITTTVSNSDLVLEASGTGRIYVPLNDVTIGKTLTVTGLTTLVDTGITGTLTHVGATTRTGDVTQTGSYTLNGNLTVSNIAQFKDVNITNNVITTTLTNSNLQLGAAGTGIISVPTNNVTIDNNLTVTGTTFTANINNSGTVTAGTFTTGNISINGNTIQTTVGSSNLQLQAAGTGYIQLEQFDVQENEIRINTGADMVLTPNGIGIVTVNTTQSIKLPVGNNLQRPTAIAGMVRFNSELTRYEGYNGGNWVRLDGVEDADGNTKITAELTPGANDNTIRFYTNSTQVADLTSTRLNVINVNVDAININNNVISTTTTNTDLVLTPNGTGTVRTGNFSINGSTVTNTVNNSITYFNQTGDGYVKINSTGGFVIPTGLTTQRPPLFDIGMMRYNTDPGNFRVEIWDGGNWVNAGQAAGGGVTLAEAQDIGIVSAIIFG